MRQKTQQIIPVILLLFVASCVQLASEQVAPTEVSSNTTWTPTASATVPAAATETPTETAAATEDVLAPTDPVLAFDTQTPIPTATATPTETATATATFTATATATPTEAFSGLVQEGTAIAQDNAPTVDPGAAQQQQNDGGGQITEFQASATALIANATQTQVVAQTQTAIAILGPTSTPTPDTAPTQDPNLGTGVNPTSVPIVAGADCIHEVRTVDQNLYRLSLAYGVTIRSIRNENGGAIANPDLITLGQRLLIPGCGTTGGRPPATSTPGPVANAIGGPGTNTSALVAPPNGDCSWGTSVEFPNGCPTGNTATSGNVGTGNTAAATGQGGPGAVSGIPYTVEQGDTLSTIALQFGTTAEAIAAANGLGLESTIFFNQELIIPQ